MKKWLIAFACVAAGIALAADLAVSTGWTYNKNGRVRTLSPTTVNYSIASNYVVENVQSISTNLVGDALELGNVTIPGFAWFKNYDTNYVEIGCWDATSNFVAFLKLMPTNSCTAWLSTTAPRARANIAPVKLDYMISDR